LKDGKEVNAVMLRPSYSMHPPDRSVLDIGRSRLIQHDFLTGGKLVVCRSKFVSRQHWDVCVTPIWRIMCLVGR